MLHSRNDLKILRQVTYGKLTNIKKSKILKLLKTSSSRKYLLYLFDRIYGITRIDPSLKEETIEFKKEFFYRINIGAYYPPRMPSNILLGPNMYVYAESDFLNLRCLLVGEEHFAIDNSDFNTGYPFWQWISEKAKETPIDLYTETRYNPVNEFPMVEQDHEYVNYPSMLTFLSYMPGTEHYLRHHRCDVRMGFGIKERDSSFTKLQQYFCGRQDSTEDNEERKDLVEDIKESGKWVQLVKYLSCFTNDDTIFKEIANKIFEIFPESGPLEELLFIDENVRRKIKKQLKNLRIDIDVFSSSFIDMFDHIDSSIWAEMIFSSPFDAYLLARLLRNFDDDTLDSSPSNYELTYPTNAVVVTGLGHTLMYSRFIESLEFEIVSKFTEDRPHENTLKFDIEPF